MTTIVPVEQKSTKKLLTGNEAVAEAVRIAQPKVVPAYPITPQTTIVEILSKMVSDGRLDAEYIAVESEHSAMSAAIGAVLGGSRAFTATSSHGLMYMGEMVFWAGLTRVPIVMAIVNRSLNPWNIWPDHQDSMAFRDAGWLQFYAKNNQEVLDLILIAFKVAEHHKVWMPAMVCLDGFILSHTSALVSIPSNDLIYGKNKFIEDFDPLVLLNSDKPFAHGALTDATGITELRHSLIQGFENSKVFFEEVNKEYANLVGRKYGDFLEVIGDPDAKIGVMALGTMGEEAEEAIIFLKEKMNIIAKSIRPRVFRPFPKKQLIQEITKLDKLLILDRAVSFGNEGQLASEVKALMYDENIKLTLKTDIVGLGGMDVNYREIAQKLEDL
ncbi:MAG: pyruvate ferredoxin oxidoreductase [Candidatus Hodarchaeales archaeon]|jgi:pyruvate ferredoxin oxidoreductase alpha subunit